MGDIICIEKEKKSCKLELNQMQNKRDNFGVFSGKILEAGVSESAKLGKGKKKV